MKIEVHIYHHFVRDDHDCNVLEALAAKLRKSSDKLASAVSANTPAQTISTPVKEK